MEQASYKASVDGLGKQGDRYTFLLCLDAQFPRALKPGDSLMVSGVPVTVTNFEDGYLSFALTLEQVADTPLAEVTVGSEVILWSAGVPPARVWS